MTNGLHFLSLAQLLFEFDPGCLGIFFITVMSRIMVEMKSIDPSGFYAPEVIAKREFRCRWNVIKLFRHSRILPKHYCFGFFLEELFNSVRVELKHIQR